MTGRILIVENDGGMRDWLTRVLAARGYQTCAASDQVGALFQLGAEQPGLVILGEYDPDLLLKMRALSAVPIIVLTTDGALSGVDSLDRGADYYVAKPPGSRELEAKVRASFRRY